MPRACLIFFRETNGNVPVRSFIRTLQRSEQLACWEAILLLQEEGSQISGKHAKNLGHLVFSVLATRRDWGWGFELLRVAASVCAANVTRSRTRR